MFRGIYSTDGNLFAWLLDIGDVVEFWAIFRILVSFWVPNTYVYCTDVDEEYKIPELILLLIMIAES